MSTRFQFRSTIFVRDMLTFFLLSVWQGTVAHGHENANLVSLYSIARSPSLVILATSFHKDSTPKATFAPSPIRSIPNKYINNISLHVKKHETKCTTKAHRRHRHGQLPRQPPLGWSFQLLPHRPSAVQYPTARNTLVTPSSSHTAPRRDPCPH